MLRHPCGIPEESGPQSSHLAVQILLQNSYPFYLEDLEKGAGDVEKPVKIRVWQLTTVQYNC